MIVGAAMDRTWLRNQLEAFGRREKGAMMDVVSAPTCILTPSADEGPYFVDERLLRSDIRSDAAGGEPEEGVDLGLTMRVVFAEGDCPPLPGAHVDIWHCNARGNYSDEPSEGTVGRTFLRGCQRTDADGRVDFRTIFPGWYAGRAVHIHAKIRVLRDERVTSEFTTQFFFDEALIDAIHMKHSPYDERGKPQVANTDDYIFTVNGPALTVPVTGNGDGDLHGLKVVGLAGLEPDRVQ